ncbi:MAG: T9SS type A sorting domain-containing protein, partial [Bacteroidetes bacterium]|nr:T9SS type A sorting domain-containing protein [Bacteroidota bacterium]
YNLSFTKPTAAAWKFSITDFQGRLVSTHIINTQGKVAERVMIGKNAPAGIYFYTITDENGMRIHGGKMVRMP